MAKNPAHRLAGEVAEASRSKSGRQRSFPNELIATARRIERLLQQRRKVRAEERRIERDLKHEKKMLKALAGAEAGEEL